MDWWAVVNVAGNPFANCWACSPSVRMMTLPLAICILVVAAIAVLIYWVVRGPR